MSLDVVQEVGREHPTLLPTNLGATCYKHTVILVEKLRARGHDAYLMCKSPGEGQYTPPGFTPFTVTGLDDKPYPCSGVSHDAIWCDGKQFDTIGSANEHDRSIYRRNGDPNWSFDSADGPRILASPAWDEIPAHKWRANNPPFRGNAVPTPTPRPTPVAALPGREEMMKAGEWLDAFYSSQAGLQRLEGLSKKGRPDWEGVGAWLFDVYLVARLAGKDAAQARAAVEAAIRETGEWKGKHPNG